MEVATGSVVDGRYQVRDRLGSGGMADVYRADDTHLGREVALKVLHRRFARDSEFVERFRREASAAAGLQHPNIVNVYDRGEHESTYYIAMEHLPGRTLKEVIAEEAPLDQQRAIDIAIQILRGAGFGHQRGVIHRDLKPHNAIVDERDSVKVTDFGIARAGASEMTETGSIMGTAQYLSPEQAQGHGTSPQSDVYSVGVVLYEMLAGTVPFEGDSAVAIALKHVNEAPPPLHAHRPDIHPALEQAVMAALAKRPEHRYASADDFIAALEDASRRISTGDGSDTVAFAPVAGLPPDAPDPTAYYETYAEPDGVPPQEERERRWGIVLIAVLLLALIAALAWAFTRPEKVRVPDVVGEQLVDARVQLERRGFDVEVERVRDVAPVDDVIAQDPGGGDEADEGSAIELTVSDGPGQRAVPAVEGLSERRAVRELNDAGFERVTTVNESSSDVRRGRVIRTSPDSGDRVELDTRIRLFVSTGPEKVEVPDVVGLTQGSAESALERRGLTAVVEREESDRPEGDVIRQNPEPGREVDDGDRVTIVVSEGPGTESVPGVVGLTASEARSELAAAGFRVVVRERSTVDETEDGRVVEQRPGAGSEERRGRTVTIFVGRFEEPEEPETPDAGGGPTGRPERET